MKIIHTADWHLGQLFYQYDRVEEHRAFLDWLVTTIVEEEEIDVLLISGDVFDVSNPSAIATMVYYSFLRDLSIRQPDIQVIITAGNHDSPARLEAPKALLEAFNVHIVGVIPRDKEGNIEYSKLIIPIRDREKKEKAWCIAVPFLRQGDYPTIASSTPYSDGITTFYQEAYRVASELREEGEAILAMGHLHTMGTESSEGDRSERLIMGGIEYVPVTAFHPDIDYVALGHIHKPQQINQQDHIRYSGSPIPMSFSEVQYPHQVIKLDISRGRVGEISPIRIPLTIPLLKIPKTPKPLQEVLTELEALPQAMASRNNSPYIEIHVLLDAPEPSLRYKIEQAIKDKDVRMTRIVTSYLKAKDDGYSTKVSGHLVEMKPIDLLEKIYEGKYQSEIPKALQELFEKYLAEAQVSE